MYSSDVNEQYSDYNPFPKPYSDQTCSDFAVNTLTDFKDWNPPNKVPGDYSKMMVEIFEYL